MSVNEMPLMYPLPIIMLRVSCRRGSRARFIFNRVAAGLMEAGKASTVEIPRR
ncbi:hypothetical protein JN12_00520 [Geobacter argillaceus]|uniref:Uncharacterized protein n=1 Tax=Geobacter argillaceus TaxID=345631 RepID=A0A562WS10_9BACT|nr:hypothetical protein JN12_00520 [Geobacter argillaceus]